ncbi:MAG: alkaline phosphatase family protein [Candidatus Hydrogenedentes bacterium]|nr:alkaline phosphatase family protein [Candidatus Hydrogenedentota bacterium]
MKLTTAFSILAFVFSAGLCPAVAEEQQSALVIVLDGLRPDYVTSELMPNLHALGERGVVCANHHSVFPTVTRVNASSFATGCYPARHGILGNTIYVPEVDSQKPFSTGNAQNLMKVEDATGGKLLTAPSLGEILDGAGIKLFVASAGSSGSSYLLNHKVKGGGIVNSEMVLPESTREGVEKRFGPEPAEAYPQVAGNRRAVDALVQMGIAEVGARVSFLWITDPDHTAHSKGIGTPDTVAALKHVDEEVGRLLSELEARKLSERLNIFVTSDHGFSTHSGPANLMQLLVQEGVKKSLASTDVIVSEGAIYVDNHDDATINRIVDVLHRTPWIGPVFTAAAKPGDAQGRVPGTFSFDSINWNHERSGDILVDVTWSDEANQYGWKGMTAQGGIAGHGTSSPFDIHNTLIAAGPALKTGMKSNVPTANVDIAPTVCRVLGISPPAPMDGRVMAELLKDGPEPASVTVSKDKITTERALDDSTYTSELHKSVVNEHSYFDYAITRRGRR